MPYLYIFSEGEVLRAGVMERIRRGRLVVIGYVVVSLGMFAAAAPIYWFFLFRNLFLSSHVPVTTDTPDDGQPDERTVPGSEQTSEKVETETVKKCKWCGREYSEETQMCPVDGQPLVREKRA